MKFSEKLIKLRKENKLSQEQLANMLDVSRQSVSKWESGQTYPEMDKLLSLCKIFKCSLDDLTNDEIQELNNNQNKKNSFINMIYEMLEFINKSISMLKSMSFKEIIKMLFVFFILGIFLLILRIPFSIMIELGFKIFHYLDMPTDFSNLLYHIWELLINIIYLILFIIIFIYIYKVRYLDKFEENEKVIVKYINEKKEDDKAKKEIKVEERVIIKKERSFALFNILGTIIKYIIKFIAICIFIPFACVLAILAFFLIIDIVLIFKGVVFIGILLGLIFALLFNYMIIEVMFKFIFNMHINFKKIFIIFITSIIGVGISVGIFTLEATTIKVYDEMPKEIKSKTITKEMTIDKDSYISYTNSYDLYCHSDDECNLYIYEWDYNIIKKYDENMKDKVKIEFNYNQDYTKLEVFKENKKMDIVKYASNDYNTLIRLGNIIIDDLKNKEIYNYDFTEYQQVTVIITTSESNHELLDKNALENAKKIEERHIQDMYYQYEQQINDLEQEIVDLNNKIYELQDEYFLLDEEKNNEIECLKEEIENYKEKIQEYKDKISDLIEE